MGSKRRIASQILPIMVRSAEEHGITQWVEPFVGGGNLIDKVPTHFHRFGFDINEHVIAALKAIRDCPDTLPSVVSRQHYRDQNGQPPSGVSSWIRFVCSFGGKFEAGYAANMRGSNYALSGVKSALVQSQNLSQVYLESLPYQSLSLVAKSLIYCDPPYLGTTTYKGTIGFNHEEFYTWCRLMKTKGHVVFLSEYQAPADFKTVWDKSITSVFDRKNGKDKVGHEKLFML